MKQQLIIGFFLLGAALCFPLTEVPPESSENVLTLFENLFKEKCDKNVNVSDVMKTTLGCLKKFIPKSVDELKDNAKQEAMRDLCSTASNYVKVTACYKDFDELLAECNVPIQSYLKSFLLKVTEELIKKMCSNGSGGFPNFEVLFKPDTISCLESSSAQMNRACGPDLNVFRSTNVLGDESTLYGDLNKISSCYKNYISHCSQADDFKLLILTFEETMKSSYVYRATSRPVPVSAVRPSYTSYNRPSFSLGNNYNYNNNLLPVAGIAAILPAIAAAAPLILVG